MFPLSDHTSGVTGIALNSFVGIPIVVLAAGAIVLMLFCRRKPGQP